MATNAFCARVGCPLPLQLAGMGGVSSLGLVAAVARAGGLGMVAGVGIPRDVLEPQIAAHGDVAPGAVGVNFLVPFLDPAAVDVAARHARVVEFFYGDPRRDLVERVHTGGALASWQVGSVAEARAAGDAGSDLIVAQGVEAGGHVRGATPLFELLEEVVAAADVPVVAAGGIATAADVRRALNSGAAAVRVGTRFLATAEADVHERYLRALIASQADDTELTECFSSGWPDAPHRVLRSCIQAARALDVEIVGEREQDGTRVRLPRLGVTPPNRTTTGAIEAMPLYAGTGVGAITRGSTVAELIAELAPGWGE